MNKKLLIGLGLIFLLGGGEYFFASKQKTSKSDVAMTQEKGPEDISEGKGSLSDLFAGAGGPSQTCTFENTTSAGKSSGVVYTSEAKMRGDFSVEVDEKLTESHMIVMDNTSYIWQDGQKNGVKSKFGEEDLQIMEDTSNEDTSEESTKPEGEYKCKNWSVNNSFFELPKGVEFTSLGEMMVKPDNAGETQLEGSNGCSACDSLSGDPKTQCLAVLDCN